VLEVVETQDVSETFAADSERDGASEWIRTIDRRFTNSKPDVPPHPPR